MSDTMTIACLLMPPELWRHDDLQFAQVNARMIEAANLIESLAAELAKARDEGFVQMSASDESDAWHAARIMDESYHVVYVAKRSVQDGDGEWCVVCSLRKLAAKGPTNE